MKCVSIVGSSGSGWKEQATVAPIYSMLKWAWRCVN